MGVQPLTAAFKRKTVPSEHNSRQEGGHIVMEDPPAFDPEDTPILTQSWKYTRVTRRGRNRESKGDIPGAVADEDALPDGERTVVPYQQEVEQGVQDSGRRGGNHNSLVTEVNRHKSSRSLGAWPHL